LALCLE